VTPLRDGMNLVAKEFVAAQNPDDPGVLILSRFAGAAHECAAALLVNPYDPKGSATPSIAPCRCRSKSAVSAMPPTSSAGAQ
jgi:trehalose-6-phosphate synthase